MFRASWKSRRPWAVALGALALTVATIPTAAAEPSSQQAREALQTAEQRLDELSDEFNGAVDDYNEAQDHLEAARMKVAEAAEELQTLQGRYDRLSGSTSSHLRRLYKLGPAVELSSLLAAEDPTAASDRTGMLRRVLASQQTDLEGLGATRISLRAAELRLIEHRDAAAAQAAEVAERRDRMTQVLAEQQDEVDELEVVLAAAVTREEQERRAAEEAARRAAAEEARQARAQAERTPPATQTSTSPADSSESAPASAPAPRANAQVAVDAALSRLGMPYRWGATGPSAFDCSGLMVWSWAQAGVSLPRTSASQFAGLTRISRSDLQPGDLVFAGSPRVHHVGMYIGSGQIVHSPRAGKPVEIRSMNRSDLRGFGRPG